MTICGVVKPLHVQCGPLRTPLGSSHLGGTFAPSVRPGGSMGQASQKPCSADAGPRRPVAIVVTPAPQRSSGKARWQGTGRRALQPPSAQITPPPWPARAAAAAVGAPPPRQTQPPRPPAPNAPDAGRARLFRPRPRRATDRRLSPARTRRPRPPPAPPAPPPPRRRPLMAGACARRSCRVRRRARQVPDVYRLGYALVVPWQSTQLTSTACATSP